MADVGSLYAAPSKIDTYMVVPCIDRVSIVMSE